MRGGYGPQGGYGPGMMQGGGMMQRGMMMGGGSAAIAVSDDAVFIFTRNTLYKFDAATLQLLGQAELPRPERRQPQQ